MSHLTRSCVIQLNQMENNGALGKTRQKKWNDFQPDCGEQGWSKAWRSWMKGREDLRGAKQTMLVEGRLSQKKNQYSTSGSLQFLIEENRALYIYVRGMEIVIEFVQVLSYVFLFWLQT